VKARNGGPGVVGVKARSGQRAAGGRRGAGAARTAQGRQAARGVEGVEVRSKRRRLGSECEVRGGRWCWAVIFSASPESRRQLHVSECDAAALATPTARKTQDAEMQRRSVVLGLPGMQDDGRAASRAAGRATSERCSRVLTAWAATYHGSRACFRRSTATAQSTTLPLPARSVPWQQDESAGAAVGCAWRAVR
jgi:hypothetical protein